VTEAIETQLSRVLQQLKGKPNDLERFIHLINLLETNETLFYRPGGEGLASVNPIFTWVRLAQRIPVRIHIDRVPEGVRLVAGMTATVEIHPQPRSLAKSANYGQPFSGSLTTRDELITPSHRLPGD
jgi:hypothetical protein